MKNKKISHEVKSEAFRSFVKLLKAKIATLPSDSLLAGRHGQHYAAFRAYHDDSEPYALFMQGDAAGASEFFVYICRKMPLIVSMLEKSIDDEKLADVFWGLVSGEGQDAGS